MFGLVRSPIGRGCGVRLRRLQRGWRDNSGTTSVEYAILLAVVAVMVLSVGYAVGTKVNAGVTTGTAAMNRPTTIASGPTTYRAWP